MKVTKVVTKAVMYDSEKGEQFTRVFIGRLNRRKVENITRMLCISVECVKASIWIPDTIVEKYAKIEPKVNELKVNEVKPAELN